MATEAIIRYCKNKGFTVTAFAYAALCHAVCRANRPSLWPVTFSVPLQPISKTGKTVVDTPIIQSVMSTVPIFWKLEEGTSIDSTAGLINDELKRAMRLSISCMDPYISVMLDAFQAQLTSNSARYVQFVSGRRSLTV